MKKVLVTGGSGFIGSFLCERLIDEDHKVIAIDNFYTGKKTNLSKLINHPNFTLIHHDVVDPINLEVDWIFNLDGPPVKPNHTQ